MILVKSKKLNNGLYALSSSRYDEKFKDIAKQVPGTIWDKKLRAWVGYADSISLIIKRLEVRSIGKIIGEIPTTPVKSLSVHKSEYIELRSYQVDGINFILEKADNGVLLADDTGLGKSIQSIIAIQNLSLPAVIVCPSIVKYGWQRELKKLNLDSIILDGIKPPNDLKITKEDGIVIINYDIVYAWESILAGAHTFIFDECHALINEKSRRSRSCKKLAHQAKYRIALSATPMSNRPKDLWNVIDTISPNRFGNFFNYALHYCNAEKETIIVKGEERSIWKMDGASHLDELSERMKHFMLRRTKKDVALQLPPKTRQIIELDIKLSRSTKEWNLHNKKAVRNALNITAQTKLDYAVELAIEKYNENSSVILFAHERAIVHDLKDIFAKQGISVYTATGEDSAKRRDEIVQEAKTNAPSIMCVTTHSMGEGIDTLSFADIGIVVELDYSPTRLIQMEGRLHRSGQLHNVLFLYLIALGTIDEFIKEAVIGKLEVFEEVIGKTDDLKEDLKGNKSDEDELAELRDMLIKMGEQYK